MRAEWKEGPDNLWALHQGEYLLVECKSEVEPTRKAINKHVTVQLNNSCAWFAREYPGATAYPRPIIPTRELGKAAGFNSVPVRDFTVEADGNHVSILEADVLAPEIDENADDPEKRE